MSALTLATIPDLPGAACVGADVDLWHAPEGIGNGNSAETDEQRRARVSAAKAVCGGCPVREACLSWAERHPEVEGIWGGLTKGQRKARAEQRHGTRTAYALHLAAGELACDPCLIAERDYQTERRAKERAREGTGR